MNLKRELFLKRGIEYRIFKEEKDDYDLNENVIIAHHTPYYSDKYHLLGITPNMILNTDWHCPTCNSFMFQQSLEKKLRKLLYKLNKKYNLGLGFFEKSEDLIIEDNNKKSNFYKIDLTIGEENDDSFIILINLLNPNDYNNRVLINEKIKKLEEELEFTDVDYYFSLSYFNELQVLNEIKNYILDYFEIKE